MKTILHKGNLIFSFLIFFATACNSGISVDPMPKEDKDKLALADSSIKTFFHWYDKNYKTVNDVNLVMQKDSGIIYRVDQKEVQKFLNAFMDSRLVTKNFCDYYYRAFHICDSVMQVDKQKDGPPYGFDADIILCSQEPDVTFKSIYETKTFSFKMNRDTATSTFGDGKVPVRLVFSNEKWLIDQIGCYDFLNKK